MYYNNAEWVLSLFYPSLTWSKKTDEKVIYLTFDDGPIPEVTEYVLDELNRFSAKATFFCVGHNIEKNRNIFDKLTLTHHSIGNHTFNHLNGWKTENDNYFDNIRQCEAIIGNKAKSQGKKLFRPPYGKIKYSQLRKLKEDYEIVMWDVLTGDFNVNLNEEKCLKKAIKYTDKGSIVIFHDSIKSQKNLQYVLPRYLEHYSSAGYKFEAL